MAHDRVPVQNTVSDSTPEADAYEAYEAHYDPQYIPAHTHRRGPRVEPHRQRQAALAALADPDVLESDFQTTYQPSRFERRWLLTSLQGFVEQGLITDVLALVKGGKEACVYRCAAHPATGVDYLAAKVYRPRLLRNLRNDIVYREGREILEDGGRVVKNAETREMRAIHNNTSFGQELRHMSWLMYEYTTLRTLHAAGGAVPRPWAAGPNAILMEYLGDDRRPAPTLHEVALEAPEARRLYAVALRNVELMLQHGLIHGDLSAYNLLYWEGRITLIDFPQVVQPHVNRQAERILGRDLARTCEYFQAQGVACDSEVLLADLWRRYGVTLLPPELPCL